MVTSRKLIVPIFDYRLDIIIYDNWNEVSHIFDNGPEPLAVTRNLYGKSIVAVNAKSHDSIVHEAMHVVNDVWMYIGYTPIADNDEVSAYLITYIYKKINEVFQKHRLSKES